MMGEKAAQIFRQRAREMSPRRRLSRSEHGMDLPQLGAQLVDQRTADEVGAQCGAIGIVLAHLECAEDEVAQFGQRRRCAQR